MLRTLCKSKIHRATVTEANLAYTGSLTLDARLMEAADIIPYEQVHVLNLANGSRITTYCMEGAAGSGTVCVNGAAAHLMSVGDEVIILTYVQLTEEECRKFQPKILLVDKANRVQQVLSQAVSVPGESSERSFVTPPSV